MKDNGFIEEALRLVREGVNVTLPVKGAGSVLRLRCKGAVPSVVQYLCSTCPVVVQYLLSKELNM